jgi:ribonuclease R
MSITKQTPVGVAGDAAPMSSVSNAFAGSVRIAPSGTAWIVPDDRAVHRPRLTMRQMRGLLDGDRVTVSGSGSGTTITVVGRPRSIVVGVVAHTTYGLRLETDRSVATAWVQLPHRSTLQPGQAVAVELNDSLTGSRLKARRVVAGPWKVGSVEHLHAVSLARNLARFDNDNRYADGDLVRLRLIDALSNFSRKLPVPQPPKLPRRRLDTVPFVTIDGPDTRDIDDAVWAAPYAHGWQVRVAIADVAAAVPKGSVVDDWALAHATSVYLPGLVVPMLPRTLSENACSLLPGQRRNVVVAEFTVAGDGTVGGIEVYLGVIRSAAKLTYGTVDGYLDGVITLAEPVRSTVAACADAAAALGGARSSRLEMPELIVSVTTEPVVTADGTVMLQPTCDDTASHRVIEELMVAANEAVGRWIADAGHTTLYRRQDAPAEMPLRKELAALAGRCGGDVVVASEQTHAGSQRYGDGRGSAANADGAGGDDVARMLAAEIAEMLAGLVGDDETSSAGASRVLRALGRAFYAAGPGGHFHLGTTHYLHFTSPIRRYADLAVHRVVHAIIAGEPVPYTDGELVELGEWVTARSAAADWAESGCRRSLWATVVAEQVERTGPIAAPALVQAIAERVMVRLPHWGLVAGIRRDQFGAGFQVAPFGLSATFAGGQVRVGQQVTVTVSGADPVTGELTVSIGASAGADIDGVVVRAA